MENCQLEQPWTADESPWLEDEPEDVLLREYLSGLPHLVYVEPPESIPIEDLSDAMLDCDF